MSSRPRTRACRFSSVTSRARPRKASASAVSAAVTVDPISSVSSRIPRRRADSAASSRLSWLVNLDGSRTPRTRSAPRASTATAAVNAESIPPDIPSTTPGKRFFTT